MLLIDATDRNKIGSDQSIHPLKFFANTSFKKPLFLYCKMAFCELSNHHQFKTFELNRYFNLWKKIDQSVKFESNQIRWNVLDLMLNPSCVTWFISTTRFISQTWVSPGYISLIELKSRFIFKMNILFWFLTVSFKPMSDQEGLRYPAS